MLRQRLVRNRADRIAAAGRVLLASAAVVAVRLDAPSPASSAPVVTLALLAYLLLALGFAALAWLRPMSARPVGGFAHAVDLLLVALLVYLTNGASSPFFPLFLFTILSATLRWNWRGALWTTLAVAALFLPTGFVATSGLDPARDDVVRYIVRACHVIVSGGLLVYFGLQRERVWREVLQLSRPIEAPNASTLEAWIEASLGHAARFFGAQRALFIWEAREEPGVSITSLDDGAFSRRAVQGSIVQIVDPSATGGAFSFDAAGGEAQLYRTDGSLTTISAPLFRPAQADVQELRQAIVASVASEAVTGWLVISKPPLEADLYLATAIAGMMGSALDRAAAVEAWRAAAAGEERIRLAHDLHDGILQTLTGISLQLRAVQQEAIRAPEAASERIARLDAALRAEQQELRAFVEGLRPRAGSPSVSTGQLNQLARLLGYQWDLAVDAEIEDPPPALAAQVGQILREATANAARHGNAQRVAIKANPSEEGYVISISDDGSGFSHHGRFTAQELRAQGFGPRSLIERVERLGGAIVVESASTGLQVEIALPQAAVLAA